MKKRAAALACTAVFAAQFAAVHLVAARPPLRAFVPSAIASGCFWLLVAAVARGRAPRTLAALASATVLAVQIAFFRFYRVFLDEDATGAARHMWADVRPTVVHMLPSVLLVAALVAAVEWALLSLSAPVGRRARLGALGAGLLAAFFLPPLRAASPDLAALSSLRVFFRTHEARAAASVRVPVLRSRLARLPNVLFLLDESVRASDYDAATAPETLALTEGRVDLGQMRSVASYTSIAVASLLSGLPPTDTERAIQSAPYVFDWVRAVRLEGRRPYVAYFSSQSESLFERRDVRSATDVFVTVDDLVGHRAGDIEDTIDLGVDRMLAARVERELPKLPKPFFAMVHLSGTHAPYFVDDARAPFRPYTHAVTWAGLPELHAAYRDAIFDQDASVARVVRAFFSATGDAPAIVVFTSDHGEAFGERGAIHHGQSVEGGQIHVPGWILARGGALDGAQARALAAHGGDFVSHLDLVPTLLDAYGVLGDFAAAPLARRLAGRSLLRSGADDAVVPLTNCTQMFPCPVRTWGVMRGGRELVSQQWDGEWRCVDLGSDAPVSGDPSCDALRKASRTFFPTLPNGRDNR